MKPPKHWIDVTVGDCCGIRHGYAFEGPDMSAQATAGPVVVSIGNFQYTGGFRFGSTTLKRATIEPPKDYVLRPGDVLLVMTCQTPDGEILGIPGMIPDDGQTYLHNQRLGLVVSKEEVPTSKSFLFYLFCWHPFNRHLVERATGTKVKHTSPTTIESFEFALPPFPEQRKIADILTTWDEALEKLDALIEAQERRKKALMQQLLTGKRRFPAFGKKPWKKVRMSEVLKRVFRPIDWSAEMSLSLVSLRRRCGGLFRRPDVLGSDYKTQDLHTLQADDFLVSKRQVAHGAWGLVTPEFTGSHVSKEYAIFVNTAPDKLHMPFFAWLAQTPRMIRLSRVASTGVHIEKLIFDPEVFLRESIRLPSDLEEQRQIATILDTADQQLTLLRTQRTALDQQKRGLMQRLLTGSVRVKP